VTAPEWAFTVMAVVGSLAAIRVVTAKNVVHAALYLVVTLLSVGGVYLVLAAEFVAWVQILIYVGAIVILFLFGLMLTKAPIGRDALDNQQRVVALIVALGVLAGLVFLLNGAFDWNEDANQIVTAHTDTLAVGTSLFRSYVLPFEAISFLLLAALIGAVVLARKDDAR
jgi:NADH-quinone oxidoreductase subunit J